MIMGVILAAGEANRMGEPKQLLNWKGQPLISHVVDRVKMSKLDPIRVIVGAYREEIIPLLSGVEIVVNDRYKEGQASSIRAGLDSLPPGVKGAAFILADQPLIKVTTYSYLSKVFREEEPGILIPTYRGQRGNPVIFHRNYFPQLRRIVGDKGGRELIHDNSDQVFKCEVADVGILKDLDDKEDYNCLKNYLKKTGDN